MASIPVATADVDGTLLAPTSATAGPDTIAARGKETLLIVDNNNAGAVTLTIAVPGNTKYGPANPDVTSISVTAGAHAAFRLPADLADSADGLIDVTASPSSSVAFYAVRV